MVRARTGKMNGNWHEFDELNAFAKGQGLMGGSAGDYGFLNFFEKKDAPFIESVMREMMSAYRQILDRGKARPCRPASFVQTHRARARLVEWIILEDYGIKICRENGVPLEAIEAYAFPPQVCY